METYEVTENGQVYTVTEGAFGHITKELKMSDEQKAILAAQAAQAAQVSDPLAEIKTRLDKIDADLAVIKLNTKK